MHKHMAINSLLLSQLYDIASERINEQVVNNY